MALQTHFLNSSYRLSVLDSARFSALNIQSIDLKVEVDYQGDQLEQ